MLLLGIRERERALGVRVEYAAPNRRDITHVSRSGLAGKSLDTLETLHR